MGVNNEDDDEEPLVIVADTDPNQPMVWRSSSGEKMVFKRWREMVYYVEEATTMQVETACWRRFANRL
ncbi:unnamed protein product [Brassica rapa]|uniref:Uncharacterized protein n=2 Tax=Brassica TaxID=3705 RepID=A0A8D9LZX3_BRACM|nr:unnamed protein product [Brassica napus]CAG7892315.1 unnamed protein product [Brassica rapa]